MERCKVVIENGQHFIYTPKGEKIPGLAWTRVYDGVLPSEGYVIAKIWCQLADEVEIPMPRLVEEAMEKANADTEEKEG